MIKHYYRIAIVCARCRYVRPTSCLGARNSVLLCVCETSEQMKQNKHIHKTHPNGLRLKYSTKWILEFDTDNAFDSESYVNRKITANALFQWFLFHFDRFRFGDGRLFAPIAMSAQCSCVEHSIANPMATCRNGDGLSSNIDLIYSMSEPRLGLNDNFIRIARKCAWLNCVELSDNDWVDIGIHLKLKWIQQIFDFFFSANAKRLRLYAHTQTDPFLFMLLLPERWSMYISFVVFVNCSSFAWKSHSNKSQLCFASSHGLYWFFFCCSPCANLVRLFLCMAICCFRLHLPQCPI